MKLDIYRAAYGSKSTLGVLYVDGQQECFTLEPSRDTPIHLDHPCIPSGIYQIHLTMSPHMGYVTPEVMDVPGRTAIRIHKANYPQELLGCTAVGTSQRPDTVLNSKDAFDKMMTLLQYAADRGELITAEWHEPEDKPPVVT